MPTLRQQYDADLVRIAEPTEYRTELNVHPINCVVCGQIMYVDQGAFDRYERAIRCDIDNQFICFDCEHDYEDEAYE